MKVTPKTDGVKVYFFGTEVHVHYNPHQFDPSARVVEFPKVWREGGKQYKVVDCYYCHNGNYDDNVTVRIPKGALSSAVGCHDTIEKY